MSSKLAFLSKYEGAPAAPGSVRRGDDSKKQRKKKKRPRKEDGKRFGDNDSEDDGTAIRDMDDIRAFLRGNDADGHCLGGGEGPPVVDGTLAGGALTTSGPDGGRGFEAVSVTEGGDRGVASKGGGEGRRRQRHDSDSEGGGVPRDYSRGRGRHDSDHNDDDGHGRNGTSNNARRRRHDSDTEGGSIRDRDKCSRRRGRNDSESDESCNSRRKRKERERKRRHDSNSEEESVHATEKQRDARRRHHDSDSDSRESNRERKEGKEGMRRNYESITGDRERKINHRRHRRCHDFSNSDAEERREHTSKKAKMSSGHKSGLQTSSDFAKAERKFRKRQREELERYNEGEDNGETVYRDASGKQRAVSVTNDEVALRRDEGEKEWKQRQANKGAYQRRMEEERARDLEEASNMTLARGVEDSQMEEGRKAVIREGDPMAMHAWKKQREEQLKVQASSKSKRLVVVLPQRPIYKGPQPKPNRYGLRPGYRWDGVDRGNGFEDRVLEALHSKGRKKEEAYKWSSADM